MNEDDYIFNFSRTMFDSNLLKLMEIHTEENLVKKKALKILSKYSKDCGKEFGATNIFFLKSDAPLSHPDQVECTVFKNYKLQYMHDEKDGHVYKYRYILYIDDNKNAN